MKFCKCLTLHCCVFAGYNYEACSGRFKNISVEKSELNFCIYSITLWFCAIFFIRKKLFEGSLIVDLPILLWFVFVLADSLALNFIFIYITYRCKSKAYSASYIKVYFAINNWIRCRGKKKLIIIRSKRKEKLHSQIPRTESRIPLHLKVVNKTGIGKNLREKTGELIPHEMGCISSV